MRLLAILALGLVLAAVVYFLAVGPDLLEILNNPKF
jgi:hypothetical protein